jgi:hypothetical protein
MILAGVFIARVDPRERGPGRCLAGLALLEDGNARRPQGQMESQRCADDPCADDDNMRVVVGSHQHLAT